VIYNPRRRVVMKGGTSEKDEYYVSISMVSGGGDGADDAPAEAYGQRPR
jgi:hypothetical protein